jgi:N-methylhydantoinase A
MKRRGIRLGVDIGGTFTDVAMEVGTALYSTKVLTTYSAPEQAILDGLAQVCGQAGIAPGDIDLVIHGTTLATNALIERKGARTAFLTTEGFRDVIEIRTESRFDQYDLTLVVPPPLIPREDRFTVAGRIAASGRELAPLDEAGVAAFARHAAEAGFESVAVGFIHAYVNPDHERRAAAIIAREAPELSVSISSAVAPQMREFERFNTVCANAFVKPLMASYLTRLVQRLREAGAACPVFLMQSGGGLISVEAAAEFPVRLLESGPAGGAIFAADLALRHGLDRVLSFDMGGTTAKICLIEQGEPKTARTFEVARTARFKKGSGMPISIPVIEMVEIGAGGGSLASVDHLHQIRVGPQSAGSEPGPACYGRGGDRPAVTDADLILGKIDPAGFAGGDIPLYPETARQALDAHIGAPLGLDTAMAAAGVTEIVDETMANAARVHAVENGKALSDFTMIAFGGAAPLHAARLCEKLGMRRVLIPPGAGVGSAIGFLRAPFGFEAVRGAYARLSTLEADWLNGVLDELAAEAQAVVAAGYRGTAPVSVERKAFMRYRGQGWEIPVPLGEGLFGPDAAEELRAAFTREYERLFGRPLAGLDIEVMNWSVRAASPKPETQPVAPPPEAGEAPPDRRREVFDSSAGAMAAAAVHDRLSLAEGAVVLGPAVIGERETTTVLPSGFAATRLTDGSLLLSRTDDGEEEA